MSTATQRQQALTTLLLDIPLMTPERATMLAGEIAALYAPARKAKATAAPPTSLTGAALAQAVQWAMQAHVTRSKIPVLNQVHLEANGHLTVTATNLERLYRITLPTPIGAPFALLADPTALQALGKAHARTSLVLQADVPPYDPQLKPELQPQPQLHIADTGGNAVAEIRGMAAAEFPNPVLLDSELGDLRYTAELTPAALDLLATVLPAVSTDTDHQTLTHLALHPIFKCPECGLLLIESGHQCAETDQHPDLAYLGMAVTGANGFVAVTQRVPVALAATLPRSDAAISIPPELLKQARKLTAPTLRVYLHENRSVRLVLTGTGPAGEQVALRFQHDCTAYPNALRIYQSGLVGATARLRVSPAPVQEALTALLPLVRGTGYYQVELGYADTGELQIIARAEAGDVCREIPVDICYPGDFPGWDWNAQYLKAALDGLLPADAVLLGWDPGPLPENPVSKRPGTSPAVPLMLWVAATASEEADEELPQAIAALMPIHPRRKA